ncbi:hypothetical protein LINPERHAP2_LOCUS7647 [Linum perenne]
MSAINSLERSLIDFARDIYLPPLHYNMFGINRRDKRFEFLDIQVVFNEGVFQPRGSKECGFYLMNVYEVWEGKVEDYMFHRWKLDDYYNNRRDAICLELVTSPCNTLFDDVMTKVKMRNTLFHPAQ